MKVAIYGGSFDPFHYGHRKLIEAVLNNTKIKRLIVMPLGLAPHKEHYMTPATYRLAMTRAGVQGLDKVRVSDYEIRRAGQYSYTIDTIKYFKEKYRAEGQTKIKVYLIYGSDALHTIESWHKPAEIMSQARLLIALRGNEDREIARERAHYLEQKYGAKIKFFEMDPVDLSATEIRRRLAAGEVYPESMPTAVAKLIEQNQIYRFFHDMAKFSKEARIKLAILEQKIADLITFPRLIHSLNVVQYAVHLAQVHEVDPMKAAVAALIHDCTKQLPLKKQFQMARKAGEAEPLNPAIAHGPAAAYYAKCELGIDDREVLSAIYYHTTSRGFMTPLEQIIYLADKIEYGRPYRNLEPIRQTAENDLDQAMLTCLEEVEQALRRQHKQMHSLTRTAIQSLRLVFRWGIGDNNCK